jgi:SAM-dependent methyltransferase
MIRIINPNTSEELQERSDGLYTTSGHCVFPMVNGAYRIVSNDNYTSNFGLEWNTFQKTQIDKFSGSSISRDRFFAQTSWTADLSGQSLLEVGSGAGRFSQIILDHTEATLYSIDYSNAVEANFRNNGPNERFHLFQASVYELPFAPAQFDKVVCFGVLQHTPDFRKSVQCLIDMVKPGGEIVIDFYPVKGWYTKFCAKYLLRPFVKNMDPNRLMQYIRNNINWLWKWYRFNTRVGLGVMNRFVPICDVDRTLPAEMSQEELREWIILDTFDMFSPQYDNPQRLKTVEGWFHESGLKDVEACFIQYSGGFEAATVRGKK